MISKQLRQIYGVTNKDYLDWCKQVHKPSYKPSTQRDFLARLYDGRLVKDREEGTLTKHRRKKNA